MSQWNCSRSKACVSRVVSGRALSCSRTLRESLPLRQDNLGSNWPAENDSTSHVTVGGIFDRHSHGHSYLCTYHVTRSDVLLHEAIFNITPETNDRFQQNKCMGCMRKRSLLSGWPWYSILIEIGPTKIATTYFVINKNINFWRDAL